MREKALIMDKTAMERALVRLAHEIIESNAGVNNLAFVGIRTRGVPIAERLSKIIAEAEGIAVDVGVLDITLYRDDLSIIADHPVINSTDIDFSIQGKTIVLTDDVLYTGRTVRAAIEALMQMGRPSAIRLAVLIDRGHRELPIRADYVGKNLPTSSSEVIKVEMSETDGNEAVKLLER